MLKEIKEVHQRVRLWIETVSDQFSGKHHTPRSCVDGTVWAPYPCTG